MNDELDIVIGTHVNEWIRDNGKLPILVHKLGYHRYAIGSSTKDVYNILNADDKVKDYHISIGGGNKTVIK